jgi:hypothetical protein
MSICEASTRRGFVWVVWICLAASTAVGQWKYIGPDGGALGAMAGHPTDANVVYVVSAADYSTKLLKSADKGLSWYQLGIVGAPSDVLLVDWSNPALMYTCGYAGLRKTTNEGVTWATVSLPTRNYLQTITLDPQSVSTIHGAGYYYDTAAIGLYARSTNGGTSWSTKLLTSRRSYMYCVTVAPTNTQMVFVGGYDVDSLTFAHGRLMRSTNGGSSFSDCTGPMSGTVNHVLCDPLTAGKVYAACNEGVYRSTDWGTTWTMNSGIVLYPQRLSICPANTAVLLAATSDYGIYRSTNGGSSWEAVTSGMPSAHPKAVLIEPGNPSVMYAATTAGFCRSTNGGGQWVWSSPGIRAASVSTLAFAPSNRSRVYAGIEPDGVFKTSGALGMGTVAWQPTGSFISCRNTVPGVVVSMSNADSVFVLEGGG